MSPKPDEPYAPMPVDLTPWTDGILDARDVEDETGAILDFLHAKDEVPTDKPRTPWRPRVIARLFRKP